MTQKRKQKKQRSWRSYEEAHVYALSLHLPNRAAWRAFCRSNQCPEDIPSCPERVYQERFQGFSHWLGTRYKGRKKRNWRTYEEARAFAHSLQLPNRAAWYAFCQSGKLPDDIPTAPHIAYHGQFQNYSDWLGAGYKRAGEKRSWRAYEDARAFARSLQLPNKRAWLAYCRSCTRPEDIPPFPERAYGGQFQDYSDWLGIEDVQIEKKQEETAKIIQLSDKKAKKSPAILEVTRTSSQIPQQPPVQQDLSCHEAIVLQLGNISRPSQWLTVDSKNGIVARLETHPRVRQINQYFPVKAMSIIIPLLLFPSYCPNEALLAGCETSLDTLDNLLRTRSPEAFSEFLDVQQLSRLRLQEAQQQGSHAWELLTRPLRKAISDIAPGFKALQLSIATLRAHKDREELGGYQLASLVQASSLLKDA